MPHPFLWKTLIVAGSLIANGSGAYRDTRSTQAGLKRGAIEVGTPYRGANWISAGVSVPCLFSFKKSVSVAGAAGLCSPSVASGVIRNVAATHNNGVNRAR